MDHTMRALFEQKFPAVVEDLDFTGKCYEPRHYSMAYQRARKATGMFEAFQAALSLTGVARVEVIDRNGRSYVNSLVSTVEFSFQDDAKTLKVFIK